MIYIWPCHEKYLALLTILRGHVIIVIDSVSAIILRQGRGEIIIAFSRPTSLLNNHFILLLINHKNDIPVHLLPLQLQECIFALICDTHAWRGICLEIIQIWVRTTIKVQLKPKKGKLLAFKYYNTQPSWCDRLTNRDVLTRTMEKQVTFICFMFLFKSNTNTSYYAVIASLLLGLGSTFRAMLFCTRINLVIHGVVEL